MDSYNNVFVQDIKSYVWKPPKNVMLGEKLNCNMFKVLGVVFKILGHKKVLQNKSKMDYNPCSGDYSCFTVFFMWLFIFSSKF